MFQSPLLDRLPWLRYGLSERKDGSLRLVPPDHVAYEITQRNRQVYFDRHGFSPSQVFGCYLVHKNKVEIVRESTSTPIFPDCDGLMTDENEMVVSITVADCVPIYLVDLMARRVGVLHAGWKGILAGILSGGMERFIEQGSNPKDICVVLGPHIQAHHFEVQEDVWPRFSEYPEARLKMNGKMFIDLADVLQIQSSELGILPEQVEISSVCTLCENDYFSYRRDKPEIIEAMLAWIMKVPESAC